MTDHSTNPSLFKTSVMNYIYDSNKHKLVIINHINNYNSESHANNVLPQITLNTDIDSLQINFYSPLINSYLDSPIYDSPLDSTISRNSPISSILNIYFSRDLRTDSPISPGSSYSPINRILSGYHRITNPDSSIDQILDLYVD